MCEDLQKLPPFLHCAEEMEKEKSLMRMDEVCAGDGPFLSAFRFSPTAFPASCVSGSAQGSEGQQGSADRVDGYLDRQ